MYVQTKHCIRENPAMLRALGAFWASYKLIKKKKKTITSLVMLWKIINLHSHWILLSVSHNFHIAFPVSSVPQHIAVVRQSLTSWWAENGEKRSRLPAGEASKFSTRDLQTCFFQQRDRASPRAASIPTDTSWLVPLRWQWPCGSGPWLRRWRTLPLHLG